MLGVIKLPGASGTTLQRFADRIKPGNGWGALFLGMIFALAFCPYSGVLYFGMLIPMVVSQSPGLCLLPDFAIATGLPVILIAYLLAYSIGSIGRFYNRIKTFEVWLRLVVAILFILTGLYFVWIYFV
jgi:threonine/homoserine/homoserine lactone efflux protein